MGKGWDESGPINTLHKQNHKRGTLHLTRTRGRVEEVEGWAARKQGQLSLCVLQIFLFPLSVQKYKCEGRARWPDPELRRSRTFTPFRGAISYYNNKHWMFSGTNQPVVGLE